MFKKWVVYNTNNMNSSLLLPSVYKDWSTKTTYLQGIVFKEISDVKLFFNKISPATNITGLIHWLSRTSATERDFYLKKGFAQIKMQLLQLRLNFPNGTIRSLHAGTGGSLTLNRSQIGCILALSFVNLLPQTKNFPHCNMDRLLKFGTSEKLKCFLNYFAILGSLPYAERTTSITITRHTLEPQWLYGIVSSEALKANLLPLKSMTIMPVKMGIHEPEFEGTLQVDFANMLIGGGVLGRGSLQEEILFLMQPECLVSLLVCERMAPNEAIIIAGARSYNTYSGYGRSFAWKSQYVKPLPLKTPTGQYKTCLIAIDAIKGGTEGRSDLLMRELGKAYAGFSVKNKQIGFNTSTISTGKWGCGYFNGDDLIKLLVQWIAATLAERDVVFFPWDKPDIAELLQQVVKLLANKRICEVWDLLQQTVSNSKPPYLYPMLSLLKAKEQYTQQAHEAKHDNSMVIDDPQTSESTKPQISNSSGLGSNMFCVSSTSPNEQEMKVEEMKVEESKPELSVTQPLVNQSLDFKENVIQSPVNLPPKVRNTKRSLKSVQSTLTSFGFLKQKVKK